MITRPNEGPTDATVDIWKRLAAPLDAHDISWRQDGKPTAGREGGWVARFVPYTEAPVVRERLDQIVPGEWNLTLEPLAKAEVTDKNGVVTETIYAFKARLQILGVVREDVGQGEDYKQAVTDAFKRVAVRFGIGGELYALDNLWVPVDGDGKYAKPLKKPEDVYAEKIRPRVVSTPVPPKSAGEAARAYGDDRGKKAEKGPERVASAASRESLKAMLTSRLMLLQSQNKIGETPYTEAMAIVKDPLTPLTKLEKLEARLDAMEAAQQAAGTFPEVAKAEAKHQSSIPF